MCWPISGKPAVRGIVMLTSSSQSSSLEEMEPRVDDMAVPVLVSSSTTMADLDRLMPRRLDLAPDMPLGSAAALPELEST
jgi:hypothetical protein